MTSIADKTTFFTHTGTFWEGLYKDCEKARTSILFEQYILENDDIGQGFLELLLKKAKEGVKVTLLLDKIGSRSVYNSPLIQDIRQYGGHVEFYNNIGWLNLVLPWTWLPRNHSKLFLIDETITYIGGACIAENMADWRDIVIRLEGKLSDVADESFTPSPKITLSTKRRKGPEIEGLQYVISGPHLPSGSIFKELLKQIHSAQQEILLVTPYFLPPKRLKWALLKAKKRGVEVKITITGESDVPLVQNVSLSYLPRLMKKGIRFFAYNAGVCHAKYAIVDGRWAMLGSANLDYLSLLHNKEGNLLIKNRQIIKKLENIFKDNLKNSTKFEPEFWETLPLRTKLSGYLGRLFKKMM
ncbi:MAG: hypothetical protein CMH28_09310 [Micavibrio sp.]|nr:hypothetical protein [Micavibrio sp.]